MTGLLDRLLGWIRSLGGTDSTADAGDQAPTEAPTSDGTDAGAAETAGGSATPGHVSDVEEEPPAHKCSVCGTPVDDPEGGCPLCGSTDVVPREGDVSAIGAETMTASETTAASANADAEAPTEVASTSAASSAAAAGSDAAATGDTDDVNEGDAAPDDFDVDDDERGIDDGVEKEIDDGVEKEIDDGAEREPAEARETDVDADAHAEEGSLPLSKVTEVRTGDSDEDAVSRLRELRNRTDDEDA